MPTQQHRRRRNPLPLRDLHDRLRREQRTPRAPQRTVRRDVDPFFLAEVDDLLLRQGRMVLDLVHGGHDGDLGEEFLEVTLAVVGDADGFDFPCGQELLHALVGRDVGVGAVEVARAVGEFGEEGVISCCPSSDIYIYIYI